ncbi:MAG: extracellular solute-binding protein [Clostridiales bacterium]|nr:extracellular solute-binding protein [Clostridiales bacterium]
MKKILSILLAAMLVVGCFAGCSSGGSDEETSNTDTSTLTGTLVIWKWTAEPEIIEAYEESHPGVEIEEVIVDSGDYLSKISTTIASGGTLPDILYGEILSRGQIFSMDILEDLSEDPYNIDLSLVDESVVNTMYDDEGRVLGVEVAVNPAGLAYDRSLAEEYLGVSEPEDVSALFTDWDTVLKIGKDIVSESNGEVTLFTSLGELYYIFDGQSSDARISGTTINSSVVSDLFTQIAKFRDAGVVSKIEQWTPSWYASFGTEASLLIALPSYGVANWLAPNEEDGEADWGLIVPPGGGFNWGGTSVSITKDSTNKELAWDFIQWYAFGEGADIRAEQEETVSAAGYYTEERVSSGSSDLFSGQNITDVFISEILPTVETRTTTAYDYADICAIETVLSQMNSDYSFTAEDATNYYIQLMQEQAEELTVA